MNDFPNSEVATRAIPWTTTAKPSRKPPKTVEQLLAAAEKRTGMLRTKVIANRDKQRMELIDELYVKYGVEATTGDVSESERIVELRAKLGL
ncbi:hypothetical protein E3T43_08645 [Cryobacterium sp. Hh7]|uniref:hypothetical protein n=1 Tax=Cryobacterium sp. Hh7 TaxID=1259159 RepID=UPI00106DB1FD|nr:hypothetical protein [Cryobacterium sp. Hh7]TFD56982.1 hypothetical protein E3T43_08645 [Cryobacterium sp. Hh7]